MEPGSELVRKHLRSDGMDDDTLIRHYIETATEDVENELNYPIVDCVLQGFQPDFSGVRLPCVPTYRFDEIEIKYWNAATERETVLPTENYTVLPTEWICVVFRGTLPALMDRADAVSITINAGFAEESLVGAIYKQAILMRVASMYDQRAEWATKYQQASERMIRKIRNNNV